MNTAQKIAELVKGADAITFDGGYAVWQETDRRETFEPWRKQTEKKNSEGRTSYAVGIYPDGSTLTMRWSESRGIRITTRA